MGRKRSQRWQVEVVGAPASPEARDRLRRAVDLLLRAAADRGGKASGGDATSDRPSSARRPGGDRL